MLLLHWATHSGDTDGDALGLAVGTVMYTVGAPVLITDYPGEVAIVMPLEEVRSVRVLHSFTLWRTKGTNFPSVALRTSMQFSRFILIRSRPV